ncbi:hypothetical protein [Litoribaculum gwangyangense]|uniref:Uncharacterized protein n=1 Tax=Litoribaculum gwangyangense TaxID=1130722 RepID=A0ABP9CXP6_9FLAO
MKVISIQLCSINQTSVVINMKNQLDQEKKMPIILTHSEPYMRYVNKDIKDFNMNHKLNGAFEKRERTHFTCKNLKYNNIIN